MIELIEALDIDPTIASEVLPTCSGSSSAFAIQAAHGFASSQHDGGADRAMDLLSEILATLRLAAAGASVDLGPVDALVDRGIAANRPA